MDRQVILAAPAMMPSVIAVMNLTILHRTSPTGFLHQEHHATMADIIQGINTPTTRRTDNTPIMVPDIGGITADHSPPPFVPQQMQQLKKAHFMLFFQPPQQLMLPFS